MVSTSLDSLQNRIRVVRLNVIILDNIQSVITCARYCINMQGERKYPEVPEVLRITLDSTSSRFMLSGVPEDIERIKVKHHLKGNLIKKGMIIHVPAKLFYALSEPSFFNNTVDYQVVETEPIGTVEVTGRTELKIKR